MTPVHQRLDLRVALRPRDPSALDRFVADPHHEILARGAFRARFGPTPATVRQVRIGLRHVGLHPGATSPSGLVIRVRATVAAAERAFHVRLRVVRGERRLVNVDAPTLPRSFGRHVQAVMGLTTTTDPAPHRATARSAATGPQACPVAMAQRTPAGAYTFDQLASAYGFDSLYARGGLGQGTSVAVMEWEPYAADDVAAFQACYGTAGSVIPVDVDGGPGTDVDDVEATMDIETVVALAPRTSVLVYQGSEKDDDTSWIDVFDRIADDDRADVVSTSWGSCEELTDAYTARHEATVLAQMAAQGQTFLASTGDQGSEDCQQEDGSGSPALAVDDPASQPLATAVGGTTMSAVGPAPVEQAWNEGIRGGAGGGGISRLQRMPSWQAGPGVVSARSSGTPCAATGARLCRQVPDVSALAGGGTTYLFRWKGQWTSEGGTSASTPLWAALIAAIMSGPACGGHRLGFLDPRLYAIAATLGPAAFNDITVGDNDAGAQNGGAYPATPGYDMATGLGSPVAGGLSAGLCG